MTGITRVTELKKKKLNSKENNKINAILNFCVR